MSTDDRLSEESGAQQPPKPGFFTLRPPSRFELVFLVVLTAIAAPSVFNVVRGHCNQWNWGSVVCWITSVGIVGLWIVNLYALLRDRAGRHRA